MKIRYFLIVLLFFTIFYYIGPPHLTRASPSVSEVSEKLPEVLNKSNAAASVAGTRYKRALDNLIKEEGGYVNDPSDPGGETKYGISKRSYPKVDIKNLTIDQASKIYKNDFYDVMRCDEYQSDHIAQEVLEQSVNMGIKTAVSFLQVVAKGCGSHIEVDGKMGKATMDAVKAIDAEVLLIAIKALAIAHYLELARERPPMRKYLKGWIKRVQF